ncbi:hypothetical protein EHP00_2615, partial [Ecytonucleospora hepatopenaei]
MKNKVEKIEILVHRGAGACSTLRKLNINVNAKDNSKKAFECAIENGYNLVETDVKYFNRSKILVTHDKVKLTKNRKSRTKKEFTKISNQLLLDEPSSKNNFSGNKPPQHTENNPLFVNELNNYKNKLKFNVELKRCLKRHSSIFVDIFLDTISIDILHSISTFDHNIYFELIKHKKVVENKICVFYIVDNQS